MCHIRYILYDTLDYDTLRTKILSDVSAFARPGAVLAVMGSSGCGKSTLLDVLARRKEGLISGEIEFNGQTCFSKTEPETPDTAAVPYEVLLAALGYVPQFDLFLSNLTCFESLMYTARLTMDHQTRKEQTEAVLDVLERVGLSDIAHHRIGTTSDQVRISGGQR